MFIYVCLIFRLLVHIGMITIRDAHTFWFSIPNMGTFIRQVTEGRKKILQILKRKRYKEIMLPALETAFYEKYQPANRKQNEFLKSLATSDTSTTNSIVAPTRTLSFWFHIRELLGSGYCVSVATSNGTLIKAV